MPLLNTVIHSHRLCHSHGWLVHSTLVISSYSESPYMEIHCTKLNIWCYKASDIHHLCCSVPHHGRPSGESAQTHNATSLKNSPKFHFSLRCKGVLGISHQVVFLFPQCITFCNKCKLCSVVHDIGRVILISDLVGSLGQKMSETKNLM